MYYAKQAGGNSTRFFDTSMNEAAIFRMSVEKELTQAVDRGEFSLHYQPQVNLVRGGVLGVEALLRWTNDALGQVPPLSFISIAESNGLIFPIGEWVLRTACQQVKTWRDNGVPIERIAVNVSALQFAYEGFPDTVARILEETDLEPSVLELEITESMLMEDGERSIDTLIKLKTIGVLLAIDDFGVGYSSLNYLKRFPIDRLKIDRSFLKDITVDNDGQAIICAIIAMADNMKLRVMAEGVETEEQMQFLRNKKCHEAQGFLISRPMIAEDAERFLRGSEPSQSAIS